jgi:hypothetical protein
VVIVEKQANTDYTQNTASFDCDQLNYTDFNKSMPIQISQHCTGRYKLQPTPT